MNDAARTEKMKIKKGNNLPNEKKYIYIYIHNVFQSGLLWLMMHTINNLYTYLQVQICFNVLVHLYSTLGVCSGFLWTPFCC